MFLRIDKLLIDLPAAKDPDHNAAASVQELMGGRFGEMSTMMNYMFQSFNFKGKKELKPYYDLIANIAAEEMGHVELVAAAINNLLNGALPEKEAGVDPASVPLDFAKDLRNPLHFIAGGGGSLPMGSMGQLWNGDYVFSSGNLVLDLLHNFFLECSARTNKLRVYEMVTHPTAKEMVGYLLVRGGVHTIAYAKALESLTGVEIPKLLPIPKIDTSKIPESRRFMDQGLHQILYRFSPDDYKDIGAIWKGTHPEDGSELFVRDGPPEGGEVVNGGHDSANQSPEYEMDEILEIAKRLHKEAGLGKWPDPPRDQ